MSLPYQIVHRAFVCSPKYGLAAFVILIASTSSPGLTRAQVGEEQGQPKAAEEQSQPKVEEQQSRPEVGEQQSQTKIGEESTQPTVTHKADVFERLWNVYPNKSDRNGAIQAWNNLKVTDEELYKMRVAFPSWKFSSQWMEEEGKNVPPLATWLGDRMWEKQPPPQAPPTVSELSSFLIQPFYFVSRVVYAVGGTLVGGVMYPFDSAKADTVLNSSWRAPWVWHEFLHKVKG